MQIKYWLLLACVMLFPSIGLAADDTSAIEEDTPVADKLYNIQFDYALAILLESSLSIEKGFVAQDEFNSSSLRQELINNDPFVYDLALVYDAELPGNKLYLAMKADSPVTPKLQSAVISVVPNHYSFYLKEWEIDLKTTGDGDNPGRRMRDTWRSIPNSLYVITDFCRDVELCALLPDDQKARFYHKCEAPFDGARRTEDWGLNPPTNPIYNGITDGAWCPAWLDVVTGSVR